MSKIILKISGEALKDDDIVSERKLKIIILKAGRKKCMTKKAVVKFERIRVYVCNR